MDCRINFCGSDLQHLQQQHEEVKEAITLLLSLSMIVCSHYNITSCSSAPIVASSTATMPTNGWQMTRQLWLDLGVPRWSVWGIMLGHQK